MPAVSPSFLEPYLLQGNRHSHYAESVEMYESLEIHADGEYPAHLIEDRRPAESDDIKNYRKKIFVPITKPYFTKVYNSLMKIRKSQDWSISFTGEVPPVIADNETPERYLMYDFPRNGSITNWYFGVAFKYYLIDANAVVFTYPMSFEVAPNEYYKPYPRVYDADDVIDYKEGKYYLLKEDESSSYTENGVSYSNGERYWLVQPDVIQIFEKRNSGVYEIMQVENILGYIPIRHMYGLIKEQYSDCALYESRLSGIVPKMDEAVREYSDMQASIVQTMFPTMYSIQPQACGRCKGVGEIPKENSAPVQCPSCGGKGLLPLNPFEHLVMPAPRPGEPSIPTPPMGFVQKDTNIITIQDGRIKQHLYDALAAINMEYLADVPISQSGVAKQVDREELNSFVHSVAEDSVRILDQVIYDICAWRYGGMVSDINSILPYIPVPERYDMLSGKVLVDELATMTNSKVDPAIINAAQIELAAKKFNDSNVKDLVVLKLKLDPFAGVPEDSIAMQRSFNAIDKTDYIIHSNINKFVAKALESNPSFSDLTYEQQLEVMKGYAEEMTGKAPSALPAEAMGGSSSADDKRLEAQAALKGTVGGVQGILEIQRSVSTGITEREAAVVLLEQIYGFTREQAESMIGNPKPVEQIATEGVSVSTSI